MNSLMNSFKTDWTSEAFYCLGCKTPVCSHCLILGPHKGHEQTPLEDAYESGKASQL